MVLPFAAGADGDIPSHQPFGEPFPQDNRILGSLMPLYRDQPQLRRPYPHILAAYDVMDAAFLVNET